MSGSRSPSTARAASPESAVSTVNPWGVRIASISLTFWARSSTTRTVASSAIAAPAVEVLAHLGREVPHADRLLEVPVEALLEGAGAVRRHGEGGEGHD